MIGMPLRCLSYFMRFIFHCFFLPSMHPSNDLKCSHNLKNCKILKNNCENTVNAKQKKRTGEMFDELALNSR